MNVTEDHRIKMFSQSALRGGSSHIDDPPKLFTQNKEPDEVQPVGWAPLEAVRGNNLHRVMVYRRERHRMPDRGTVGTGLKLRLQRMKQKHLGGEMSVQVFRHPGLDYWT